MSSSDYNTAIQDAARLFDGEAHAEWASHEAAEAILRLKRPEPDAAVAQDVVERAKLINEFATELRKWWSFDDRHYHTHTWHCREDFIAKKLPELLASAGLLPVQDGGWKTIESCPKDMTPFWAVTKSGIGPFICRWDVDWAVLWDNGARFQFGDLPAIWQPLPAPPVQGGE